MDEKKIRSTDETREMDGSSDKTEMNTDRLSQEESKNSGEYVAPFNIAVEIPNLNVRKGPGTKFQATGFTGRGLFTIVETATGQGSTKGWGKLMSGAGWVSLDHIKLRP